MISAKEIKLTKKDNSENTLSLLILDCATIAPLIWSALRSLTDCRPSHETQTAATGSGPLTAG